MNLVAGSGMAYRFKLSEPINSGFQRIGLEQIERAERELTHATGRETTIHETRKCLKRVRALLRLVRPGIKPKEFEATNEMFRQIGALLSEARDNQIMLQTIAKLEGQGARAPLQGLKRLIASSRGDGATVVDPGLMAAAVDRLASARTAFVALKLSPAKFITLQRGLERSYGHGRRAFKMAFARGNDEAYHELRKQVQLQWRHMQLLERAWPELAAARVSAARELSQILGDDQDLSVLKAYLKRSGADHIGPLEAKSIRGVIRERQNELRSAAFPRAQRLFAERPNDLGRHVGILWRSARLLRNEPRGTAAPADDTATAVPPLKPDKKPIAA